MILGIESTAHTFGIGVVNDGNILVNIKDSYTTESGGIIPMDAANHHKNVARGLLDRVLVEGNIQISDINAIAVSCSPGLAPCLSEGLKFAKEISKEFNIPIIPINHCIAHLEIGKITGAKDPVLLYASGANTQVIAYASGKYRVFGETLDIGIGNFIDNFARVLGIGFPGGPKIMELAKTGNYIEVPYSIKGMDVTFSGLLTNLKQKYEKGASKEDLAYSLQENAFSMLIEASERALAHTSKNELLLGGGVACNTRLQEMAKIMCNERNALLYIPENSLLVDNGAMIAYLGEIIYDFYIKTKRKNCIYYLKEHDLVDINPKMRTDDVDVFWK
jgi:N6-L-threonylcarbamoyladenine synthase